MLSGSKTCCMPSARSSGTGATATEASLQVPACGAAYPSCLEVACHPAACTTSMVYTATLTRWFPFLLSPRPRPSLPGGRGLDPADAGGHAARGPGAAVLQRPGRRARPARGADHLRGAGAAVRRERACGLAWEQRRLGSCGAWDDTALLLTAQLCPFTHPCPWTQENIICMRKPGEVHHPLIPHLFVGFSREDGAYIPGPRLRAQYPFEF